MKKWLLITGWCVAGVLLTGAVAVTTVDQLYIEPRTVSSWGELEELYVASRDDVPPLPSPVPYEEVIQKMSAADWSFLSAQYWSFKSSDGTYYVANDSQLAKLKLPLHIRIYEDLQRGEIVILSSADGEKFQGEALFKAPEFMPYEKDFPLDRYLSDELSPRRVVWEITLKSEADAWLDLAFQSNEAQTSKLLEGGGMMRMMVPEENINDLWLCLEPQSGSMNLNVFAPEGFTNRVEIYSCTNLISNVWSIAAQELLPSGTNPAVWSTGSEAVQFYSAGNMDIDRDLDGLPDAREMFVFKTDPNDADTDGDGMPDGWEIQYGLDPLSYADGGFDLDGDGLSNANEYLHSTRPDIPDTDGDGMPDGWEIAGALNPLLNDSAGDPDGDGVNNLAEYIAGTHPQIANITPPAGATGSLVFRYDDDGRLTESHLNNASAELFSINPAHNVTGMDIFTTGN